MLNKAMLFAATANAEASKDFYEHRLGLRFVADHPYAMVFDVDGIMLRVQKVDEVVAVPYTSLGFQVDDLEAAVKELKERGVVFEDYPFIVQDELGIWKTPDGARVAWCKDPDGNTVSLTQQR